MLKNQRKGTYQLRRQSSQLPPSVGSPRFARGTEKRARSVPPAGRGNLKEGVIGHTRFCELRLGDWYNRQCAPLRAHRSIRLSTSHGELAGRRRIGGHKRGVPFMLELLLGDFTMGSIWSLITLAFEVPTYRIYI